MISFVENR